MFDRRSLPFHQEVYMSWYVIQVRNGHEKEIAEKCKILIPDTILKECFIPEFIYQKKYLGTWHEVKAVMFSGYIFMITENIEKLYVELNKIPEFTKVIGKKQEDIYPLDENEETFLKSFGKAGHMIEMSTGYIQGDKIYITKGPLQGKEGLITKVDRHKRIAYLHISMFNKETVTKVGLEIISKC